MAPSKWNVIVLSSRNGVASYGTLLVTVLILFEPTDFLSKLIYPSAAVYSISQNLIPCRFVVALCCSCVVVLLMVLYLDYFNYDKNE